jgi:hypothetical protein
MALKEIHIPHLGHTVKMGRKRPVAKGLRLKFSRYLKNSLPTPPASVDYSANASSAISQMYLNDQLGDCVIACMGHTIGVLTGNATGSAQTLTQAQVLALYEAIGGYVPGEPSTDQGCDEQTALNYWMQNGAPNGGTKILGYLSVDIQNPTEYRTALWLFENLIFGLELPDAWVQNPTPGFVWGPGTPDEANGHCIGGVGYSSAGIKVMTWGMTGTITDAAIAEVMAPQYGGEMWVVLDPDQIAKGQAIAPNGINWDLLISDFDAMGGNVPVPVTPPPPPPPPVNPPAPSATTITLSADMPAGTYTVSQ